MKDWWKGLPTELQFGLVALLLGIVCWSLQFIHTVLQDSISAILTFISSVTLGVLAHGATSRLSKDPDAKKDLMGG